MKEGITIARSLKGNVSVISMQTRWALASVAMAIALPQALHIIGRLSGLGTSLGEALLPMYLPVLLASFFMTPALAVGSALVVPILSYLLQGMPKLLVLPYITVELMSLALVASLLRGKLPTIVTVVVAIVLSRIAKLLAVTVAVYILKTSGIGIGFVLTSTLKGLMGIVLELSIVPLMVFYIRERGRGNE